MTGAEQVQPDTEGIEVRPGRHWGWYYRFRGPDYRLRNFAEHTGWRLTRARALAAAVRQRDAITQRVNSDNRWESP